MKKYGAATSAAYALLCFLYVLSSLTLIGIPGLSSLVSVVAIALVLVCAKPALDSARLVSEWIFFPICIVALAVLFSLPNFEAASTVLVSTVVSWTAATAVAVATLRVVSIKVILYAIVFASVANAVAIAAGFDAYILYSADLRLLDEDLLLKRPSGLVANPNLAAIQSLLPLFLLVFWRKHCDWLLWVLCSVAAVYVFVMTGSRKGLLLVLLFVLMCAFTFGREKFVRGAVAAGAVAVIAGLAAWLLQDADGSGRFLTEIGAVERLMLALEGRDTSFDERTELMEQGFELFLASPLWGYGLDSFRHLNHLGLYAHNNFIEVLVSGGVILAAGFYAVHIKIVRNLYRMRKQDGAAAGIFIVLAILSLDVGMVTYNVRLIPLILLLLLAHTSRRLQSTHASRPRPDALPETHHPAPGRF